MLLYQENTDPASSAPHCHTGGPHIGTLCISQQTFQVPLPAGMLSGSDNIALPVPILFPVIITIIFFLLWRIVSRLLKQPAAVKNSPQMSDHSVPKVAAWATGFIVVFVVWIVTAMSKGREGWAALRIGFALVVIPVILVIEGLAMSVIELEDKELTEQIDKASGIEQARSIVEAYLTDSLGYLRAREWSIAGLIILLTMIVEFDKYEIPLVGTYEGSLARVFFTGVFASVAIIWTAQAPGKEIGKLRPVKFLSLWIGPLQAHKFLLKLSKAARWSCVDKPAELTALFLDGFLRMTDEPALSPGGSRFFAELIKRYGYGDCNVEEDYAINVDGSAKLQQSETVYLGYEKEFSYVRRFASPVPFCSDPRITSKKAWVVPALSASIENDLRKWEQADQLFQELWEREIETSVYFPNKEKTVVAISVSLPTARLRRDQAYVLKIEFEVACGKGTFGDVGSLEGNYWARTPQKPCYQSRTTMTLCADSKNVVFNGISFEASQDEYGKPFLHLPETLRFKELQRQEDLKSPDKGVATRDGVPRDGKELSVFIKYGLPGVRYKAAWHLTTESLAADISVCLDSTHG